MEAGTSYPSGVPEFTPVFSEVRVTRSLVLCVPFVNRCLFFCTFSFDHYVAVLLRYTDSDCHYLLNIKKCLSGKSVSMLVSLVRSLVDFNESLK